MDYRTALWVRAYVTYNTLHDFVHVLVTKSNSCFSIERPYIVGTSLAQLSEGMDA
jgi:hypothetical protein